MSETETNKDVEATSVDQEYVKTEQIFSLTRKSDWSR